MAETPVPSGESAAQGSGDVPSVAGAGAGGGAAYAHPRISGGNGLTLEQAVVVQATGLEMGLMLMQLWLEQVLGLKGRDWLPGTERWVDSANHAPRTVRAVGVELRDGAQREYFFDLGSATGFGSQPGGVVSTVAGVGQGPVVETVAVTTPVDGLTPPPVPQSKMTMAPPPVPQSFPVAQPPPVPTAPPAAPEKKVDSLIPELSEILNQKEKLRGGALPARRGQGGWGWWLTLTGCVAAGAAVVVWWNPDLAGLAPGAKPAPTAPTAPVAPPEELVAAEKADVSSSAPMSGKDALTEAATTKPKSNAASQPGKALSPAMESLLDEVVQAGNAALEEKVSQTVKGAAATTTGPAVPAAPAEAEDEVAPHSSNGGLSMAPVTPLEQAASAPRPTSQREMQERLLLRVQRWGDAAVRGDCRAVVECMPAGIVQTMGGVEALTSKVEEAMGAVKRLKAQPVDFRVGEVSAFAQDPAGLLAVVPTYTKTPPLPNQTTGVLRGYLIGISEDHGATWALIDHELMEEKMALSVFPELGRVTDLPQVGVDWVTPADKEDWAPGGEAVQARLEQVRGKKVGGPASSSAASSSSNSNSTSTLWLPSPSEALVAAMTPSVSPEQGAGSPAGNAASTRAQARRLCARINVLHKVPDDRRSPKEWQELVALLREAAALGHVECQYQLGTRLVLGNAHVKRDLRLAIVLLEKAASAGSADAQAMLAMFYLSGLGTSKNLERARDLALRGARQGHALAQYMAGKANCQVGTPKSHAEAWMWFTLAGPETEDVRDILGAGKKDFSAKIRAEGEAMARKFKPEPQQVPEMGEPCPEALGPKPQGAPVTAPAAQHWGLPASPGGASHDKLPENGTPPQSLETVGLEEMRQWHHDRAQQGDVASLITLSRAYRVGAPLAQVANREKAEQMMEQAVELGHPTALIEMPGSTGARVKRLRRAAKEGVALAHYQLGELLLKGSTEEIKEGLALLESAGDLGHPPADASLGEQYLKYAGDEKRVWNRALEKFTRAGDTGYLPAISRVGGMLYGDGQDEEAWPWLIQAAAHADPQAIRLLGKMYLDPKFEKKDPLKALEMLMHAAELDEELAAELGPEIEKLTRRFPIQTVAEVRKTVKNFKRDPIAFSTPLGAGHIVQDNPPLVWGAGFFIREDGYFITALDNLRVRSRVMVLNQDALYDAWICDVNEGMGLALLKVDGAFHALALPEKSALETGVTGTVVYRLPGGMQSEGEDYERLGSAEVRVGALAKGGGQIAASALLEGLTFEQGLSGAPLLVKHGVAGVVYSGLSLNSSVLDRPSSRVVPVYRGHPFRLPPVSEPWYEQSVSHPGHREAADSPRDAECKRVAASGLVLAY